MNDILYIIGALFALVVGAYGYTLKVTSEISKEIRLINSKTDKLLGKIAERDSAKDRTT